jgi:propionyl-CoA carboxylase beta chain
MTKLTAQDRLQRLLEKNRAAELGGGKERLSARKRTGRTARERIESLLDKNSFEEIDKFVTHRCLDLNAGPAAFLETA